MKLQTIKAFASRAGILYALFAFVITLILGLALSACGDDIYTRPDASPKYDACDPTISKGCVPEDAGKIIISDARSCPTDSGMCEPTCEALGCTWSEYAPTCSHKYECLCNNQTCTGTPP